MLVQLPQSQVILETDKIVAIGQPNSKLPMYVVILDGAQQAPQLPQGDYNALLALLKDKITVLEIPRTEVESPIAVV